MIISERLPGKLQMITQTSKRKKKKKKRKKKKKERMG
jgi:hypothetical protein